MNKKITLLAFLVIISITFKTYAQHPTVYSIENTGAKCVAPLLPTPDNLKNYDMLPDPFAWSNGTGRLTKFNDWQCRRNEIKAEIEQYEIGQKPNKPKNISASFVGGVLTVVIIENGQTLTLTSKVTMPASGNGPFPIVIGMNRETGSVPADLFANAIKIPFIHDQVVAYSQGSRTPTDPYFKLYPQFHPDAETYTMGNYSAWAWGISRLIDGIELVKKQMKADVKHIAVTGCSYAGKMALFAGAFDERIALTIAQESGGGGAPSWRVSETTGKVEKISNTNYSWFLPSMGTNFSGRANVLPHDHHELMAMVAPRALLITGNTDYEWLANESAYVSARATEQVYKKFGISDRFGFYIDGGHPHCSVPVTQTQAMKAFIDRFLFDDKTANTDIHEHPFPNTDYMKWIKDWVTLENPKK